MEKKNVHDLQFKNTTPLSEGGAKKNDARLSWWRRYVQELYQVLLSFDEPPRQNCRYASGANLILPIQTSLGRNPHSTLARTLPCLRFTSPPAPRGPRTKTQRQAQVNSLTYKKQVSGIKSPQKIFLSYLNQLLLCLAPSGKGKVCLGRRRKSSPASHKTTDEGHCGLWPVVGVSTYNNDLLWREGCLHLHLQALLGVFQVPRRLFIARVAGRPRVTP